MDFLSPLVSLVTGYLQARAIKQVGVAAEAYADAWFRLMASVLITVIVVFPFVWGSTALGMWHSVGIWVGLGVGFATGLSTAALLVYILWTRNPLTKGISIAVPSSMAQEALKENVTITTRS
jgi:hypothetical protein